MISGVALLSMFAAVATAGYIGHYDEGYDEHDHHPEYNFEYSVHDPHTHDIKSQHETRHGDVVKGYYKLKDADGTIREVHYNADPKTGFHAEVKKIGESVHPLRSNYGSYGYAATYGYGNSGHYYPGHAYSTSNSNIQNHDQHSYSYGLYGDHGYYPQYNVINNHLYHHHGDGYEYGYAQGHGYGHATSSAYVKRH